jgi:hypothetical protein
MLILAASLIARSVAWVWDADRSDLGFQTRKLSGGSLWGRVRRRSRDNASVGGGGFWRTARECDRYPPTDLEVADQAVEDAAEKGAATWRQRSTFLARCRRGQHEGAFAR